MSEQAMTAERLAEIKARHAESIAVVTAAGDSHRSPAHRMAHDDRGAMLAEIERAWGECARINADGEALCETVDRAPVTKLEHKLTARLLHAHDAASALYRAASSLCSVEHVEPNEGSIWSTVRTDDVAAIRAAIDPALSAAALAETQRRDGLDAECKRLNTALVNVWNTLATALVEVDHEPSKDAGECAQQAAGVIVGTLSRGPAIGQEIDLSDGRKATITEAWSNGAGWYVDVRHPDGSKGRMVQEGGVWRTSNGRPETRPTLTAEQARAMVEKTWRETGGGPREMHDAFTALLLRVAGPDRSPCRVCDRPIGDHGPDPGNGTDFGIPGACDGYEPSDVDAGPVTAEQASVARALCPKRTGAEHMTREGSGACIFCGADVTPPPEMATTTGAAPDGEECGAESESHYICTLIPGHTGGHVAHASGDRVVAEWPVSQ